MKFRKYTLNEATRNIDSMLNFIMKNRKYAEYEHQVEKLWLDVAKQKFKKELGYYPDAKSYEWSIDSVGWKLNNTQNMNYEEIAKDFENFMSKSNLSPQENKEKAEFNYIVRQSSYDGKNTFKIYGSHNFDSLLRMINYSVTGKIDKDLGPVLKWMDEKGISSSSTFSNEPFEGLGRGITITKFKNNKVVVKGLKSKSIEILKRIYKNSER